MAGKLGSRHHPTTILQDFAKVAGTSYQMLEVFIIKQSGEVLTSFSNDNSANFSGDEKYNEEFPGVYLLTIHDKTLNQVALNLESKGLYLGESGN